LVVAGGVGNVVWEKLLSSKLREVCTIATDNAYGWETPDNTKEEMMLRGIAVVVLKFKTQ